MWSLIRTRDRPFHNQRVDGPQRRSRQSDDAATKKKFLGHTILTGMFGLDGEHGLKSELHPLYAMATLRDDFENSPSDEAWLIFVRNQGDEGYCSSNLWDSGFSDYRFDFPGARG